MEWSALCEERCRLSSSQPTPRKNSHPKSHDFLLLFPEKLQLLSSPHAGPLHILGRCLPCTQQGNKLFSAAAASHLGPGVLLAQEGAVSSCFPSFPGQRGLAVTLLESFVFLRPWVSLYCLPNSVQQHTSLKAANLAEWQCKARGKICSYLYN